jgi:excisionase family DNA binding protein
MNISEIRPAFEFNNRQAAAYLGIEPESLEQWRATGRQKIPFVKIGKRIRYKKADLDRWLASRTVGAVENPRAATA